MRRRILFDRNGHGPDFELCAAEPGSDLFVQRAPTEGTERRIAVVACPRLSVGIRRTIKYNEGATRETLFFGGNFVFLRNSLVGSPSATGSHG